MSSLTDDEFDAPPAIGDASFGDDVDMDAYADDDDDDDFERDADDDDFEGFDGPPPLLDNVVDINSGVDADDPDLTGALFGVELTDADRERLIAERGLSPEYLDLPHVRDTLRSITDLEQVPSKRRWAFEKSEDGTGIAYAWCDPSDDAAIWQLRPDHPREKVDGKKAKYVFRSGVQTPVHLASAPRALPATGHSVLVVEGTNQSRAVASALRDDPQFVVLGIAGCQNAMRDGNLQPGIVVALKNAEQVYLIPDADAATNWQVWSAMDKVAKSIRARAGKRGIGKFVRLDGAEGKTGADDVLAAVDESDRRQLVLDLLDGALPTPCDVPPRKPRRGDDEDAFIIAGNIQSEVVTNHIIATYDLRIDAERDALWLYDDEAGVYRPTRPVGSGRHSSIIGNALMTMLGNDFHVRHIPSVEFSVLEKLRGMGRTIPSVFGDPRGRIPFANGNYNTLTDELEPFSPDVMMTYRLLVDYSPEAKFEAIPNWLKENTKLDDGEHQLDQLLDITSGLFDAILGKAPQKIGVPFGESRSGKGTFCNDLLPMIVPSDRFAAIGLNELSPDNRFAVSGLHGALLSVTGELPDAYIRDTSVFKAVTGNDLIEADVKHEKALRFRNRALFLMAGNHPPKMSDSAGANRNRMVGVLFPHSHAGQEDLDLVDRLTAEAEGLAYALLQAWKARQARGGKFLDEHPIARQKLSAAMNPLTGFITDCLLIATDSEFVGKSVLDTHHASKNALYRTYEAYMRHVGRGGGAMHIDNLFDGLARCGVKGPDIRAKESRARGYSAGFNLESELLQALMDKDREIHELVTGAVAPKPTKFKQTTGDTPPPLDDPVEIIPPTGNKTQKASKK